MGFLGRLDRQLLIAHAFGPLCRWRFRYARNLAASSTALEIASRFFVGLPIYLI
jgi:hypothetical protein